MSLRLSRRARITGALLACALVFSPTAPATALDIDDSPARGAAASDEATGAVDAPAGTAPENSPLAFMDPGPAPQREPLSVTDQDLPDLPDGVSVEKVEWITDRWVMLHINSAAMPERPVKVQVHLARDWYSSPEKTFPSVWQLGPLYSSEDESAWSYATDAVRFYADKNVNLVLPVGGGGSFFTDWQSADGGRNFRWETFLTKELPPILEQGWRTNDRRAVSGLSMGATGAMVLAGRNAGMFDFAASFSGYLDTSSPLMPRAFGMITGQAGFDARKMWGNYYSREWFTHDPKLLVGNFRRAGTTVYVAAGTGFAGAWDADENMPGSPDDVNAGAMEAASRVTSQTFVNFARAAGVRTVTKFRPNGTHIWPYWEYEMKQAWPSMADALGLGESDRGVRCEAEGAFAEAVERYRTNQNNYDLGDCISEVYEIRDDGTGAVTGTAQDFRGGVVYLKDGADEKDGAVATWGRTGAKYRELGGPDSWLGYPVEPDSWARDGGAWAQFDHGFIYWSQVQGGAGPVTVKQDVIDAWGPTNWEYGPWGYPVAPEEEFPVGGRTGQLQRFEHGVAVRTPDGDVHLLHGAIADRYLGLSDADRDRVGFPTGSHGTTSVPGHYTDFEHGVIYWSQDHGTALIHHGPIFDRYRGEGFEGGRYGFLTGDETVRSDGSRRADFVGGTIFTDAGGTVYTVPNRAIADRYDDLDGPDGVLGLPDMNRTPGDTAASPDGTRGQFRDFDRGVIYTSGKGTFVLRHGAIFDAYREQGYEGGELGFIVGDHTRHADGSASVEFEGGTLVQDTDGTVRRA
ncbi:alpha/beta hydrolase-fold protein [Corynebacterium sp.]|uniref:alpha/beta hydrolase-fold protein n=1 Tax=Corynebacterium sp. TaxID=1720 RepID=UPI003B3A81C3